jgi:type IV pilus assembly protein PilN
VSELLRNTLYNSAWLSKPELIEITAITQTTANKEQRRLYRFSMRVTLKRPQAPAAAAVPASGAALAAPAKSS